MDEAANIPLGITPETNKAADAELALFLTGPELMSLREALPVTTPRNPQRVVSRFSKDVSKQIIAAAKDRGLSVTTAVHAALAILMRKQGTPANGRLISFNPYNLRNYLPEPWCGSSGAASLYIAGRPCSIDLGLNKDYDAIAGYFASHYQQDQRPFFGYMVDYMQKLQTVLSAPPEVAMRAPGAASPVLSSLGIIENILKSRYEGVARTIEVGIGGWVFR